MKFAADLIEGRLVKRYKRFLADIELSDGSLVTAHCANPGSMLGFKEPGMKVWLSESQNPKRKLKYSWELAEVDLGSGPTLVGINTSHPNTLVAEALDQGQFKELKTYPTFRREVKYGQSSRVDFLLTRDKKPDCYLEIKNVHLMREDGLAEFPDSVTKRGARHLQELSAMVREGHRAVLLYLIQRGDARKFKLARDIDPEYGAAYDAAIKSGVEFLCYKCDVTIQGIRVSKKLSTRHKL
ncbi:MAG: DNA/RNA nuclease SfsA [Methyloligellaceae bacterium]